MKAIKAELIPHVESNGICVRFNDSYNVRLTFEGEQQTKRLYTKFLCESSMQDDVNKFLVLYNSGDKSAFEPQPMDWPEGSYEAWHETLPGNIREFSQKFRDER